MDALRRRLPASLRGHKQAAPEPAAYSTTVDEEALVPRWLRPSVRAARVASVRNPTPRERRAPLLFAAPVDETTDRLVVRYDLVQLLDRPDDALGRPLGELDTGDEVEVVERNLIWARVRTPAQRDGWVPAMTLASPDVLAGEAADGPEAPDVDGGSGEGDVPALEALLAIAAEQRARQDAAQVAVPKQPRKPPTGTRKKSEPARKTKKTNRRTSARKKRH